MHIDDLVALASSNIKKLRQDNPSDEKSPPRLHILVSLVDTKHNDGSTLVKLAEIIHEENDDSDVMTIEHEEAFEESVVITKDDTFKNDSEKDLKAVKGWLSLGRASINGYLTYYTLTLNNFDSQIPSIAGGLAMAAVSIGLQQFDRKYSAFLEKPTAIDNDWRSEYLGWRLISEAQKSFRHGQAVAIIMAVINTAVVVANAYVHADPLLLLQSPGHMAEVWLTGVKSAFSSGMARRMQAKATQRAFRKNFIRNYANQDAGEHGAMMISYKAQVASFSISAVSVCLEALNLIPGYKMASNRVMGSIAGGSWIYAGWQDRAAKPLRDAYTKFVSDPVVTCFRTFFPKDDVVSVP